MQPEMDVIVLPAPVVLFDASTPGGNMGDYEDGTQAGHYYEDFEDFNDFDGFDGYDGYDEL